MLSETVTIEGRFPGQNDLIGKNRMGWQVGAAVKKDYTGWAQMHFMNAIRTGSFTARQGRSDISVVWHEQTLKRDHDNILAGLKFILDGAIKAGAIPGDGQKHIGEIKSEVVKDSRYYVEITFTGEL